MQTQRIYGKAGAPEGMPPPPPPATTQVEPEPETRYGRVIMAAVLASGLVAIVSVFLLQSPLMSPPVRTAFGGGVEVPIVIGKSFEESRALLDRKGLVPLVEAKRVVSDLADGTIVAQVPMAGWYVKRGAQVKVTVVHNPPEAHPTP